MNLSREHFQHQFGIGQVAESKIAKWIRNRGNSILPIYDEVLERGKGPRVFAPKSEIVAPDMLVFCADPSQPPIVWVEAKSKTCFVWFSLKSRWMTGIDTRHYEEYLRVADTYGLPVWLMFLHQSSTPDPKNIGAPGPSPVGLFGNPLSVLRLCIDNQHGKYGSGGMTMWSVESLRMLATLSDINSLA